MIRTLLLLTLACLAATVTRALTPVEEGDRDQIFHWGNLAEPRDLDPHTTDSQQTFNIVMALFEGLAQYGPRDNVPEPAVAERWESSPDARVWTFHLRSSAKWSDGAALTARDFVYAYRRMLSPGLLAEYANMLFALKNGKAFYEGTVKDFSQVGVEAVDDRTLRLTLDHPIPYLPALVCHAAWYPVPQAAIEKHGRIDQAGTLWTRPGNLISNGPFTLADWKPNQVIRCIRNPHYWDAATVRLNEVRFYPIDSSTTEETAFRAGQLHATSTLPIEKIAVYKRQEPELLDQHLILATYVFRFNTTRPPFDDARVRRAFSLAIDRGQIVRRVAKGGQRPAYHFTPPGTGGFEAKIAPQGDIETARTLLAEAGYPGGKGLRPVVVMYNTSEGHRQIAEAVQAMWLANLGAKVTLENQEAKVHSDTMKQLNYDIARFAWVGDYLDPSTFLDIMTSDSGNNQTGWKNAEYDRIIAEANRSADQAGRYQLYQRAEEILAAEAPFAPVYFYTRNMLRRPSLKGFYPTLLDLHPLKYVYLEK